MSEQIYKTTYRIEVFSRGPFEAVGGDSDPFDLDAINYAITEGDCIGSVEILSQEPVPDEQVAGELVRIGNDGTFFDDGDDWDDDEDEIEADDETIPS